LLAALMRTSRCTRPTDPRRGSVAAMCVRASAFFVGSTLSSRSNTTASAPDATAEANRSGRTPGTKSTDRVSRSIRRTWDSYYDTVSIMLPTLALGPTEGLAWRPGRSGNAVSWDGTSVVKRHAGGAPATRRELAALGRMADLPVPRVRAGTSPTALHLR